MYHRQVRPVRTAAGVMQASTNGPSNEVAVILIPGVNVRLHYLSINIIEKPRSGCSSDSEPTTETSSLYSGSYPGRQHNKTASLNAKISIQSLPKEMVLKPSLLDFVDKALTPIMESANENDADEAESLIGNGSVVSSSGSSLYSFPVNVVVLIRVEPSDIGFSCFPVSKVECLLRIPSLDFAIISSPSPHAVTSSASPKKKSTSLRKTLSQSSQNSNSSAADDISSAFSFTVCLSRFSFCIFHPYGKHVASNTFETSSSSMFSGKRKEFVASQPMSGRKDSLSLNVEFIKFNLFRKTLKIPVDSVGDTRDHCTVVKISGKFIFKSLSTFFEIKLNAE